MSDVLVVETTRAVVMVTQPGTLAQFRAAITGLTDSGVPPNAMLSVEATGEGAYADRTLKLIAEYGDGLRTGEAVMDVDD